MSNTVQNFEIVLDNHKRKGPSSIYGQNKITNKSTCKPQDVISSVSKQLKAIQVADTSKINTKNLSKELLKCKHTSFVCVNKLLTNVQTSKQESKFNTQCVTDSQLRNIIETAEILEAHQGMTQEFETTFVQSNTEKYEEEIDHLVENTEHISNTEEHLEQACTDSNIDGFEKSVFNDNLTKDTIDYIEFKNDNAAKALSYNCSNINFQSINMKDIGRNINLNSSQKVGIPMSQIPNTKNLNERINMDIKKYFSLNNNDIKYSEAKVNEAIENDDICINHNGKASKYDAINDINVIGIDNDINLDSHQNFNDNYSLTSQILNTKAFSKINNIDKNPKSLSNSQEDINSQNKNYNQILNQGIESQDGDTNITPSPIICNKTFKRNTNTPPPLIFNLDKFENFESIANPIIVCNDFETAKHVINSQILNKELHINIDDIDLKKRDNSNAGLSGENTKTKLLEIDKVNSDEILHQITNIVKIGEINDTKNEHSKDLEDEILFSSDEENSVILPEKDLPFTCALETSSYDQEDILDKTVYVGFQTASNRSIQVLADSFTRAKNLLCHIDDEITATNLVNNKNIATAIEKPETNLKEKKIALDSLVTADDSKIQYDARDLIAEPQLLTSIKEMSQDADLKVKPGNFIGFRTANNKNIILSENSLARCKKVFQDIDLNEDFDCEKTDVLEHADLNAHKESHVSEYNKVNNNSHADDLLNCIDDEIIHEFANTDIFFGDNKIDKDDHNFKLSNNSKHLAKDDITTNILIHKTPDLDSEIYQIKAEIMYSQIISEPDVKKYNANRNISGFKTASNKSISISNNAWIKSKSVFENIDVTEISEPTLKSNDEMRKNTLEQLPNSQSDVTFKTITSEAPNCFNDVETTKMFNYNECITSHNNKKLLIRHTFEDFVKNPDIVDANQPSTSRDFVGFRTANNKNKNINISEKAMQKTKNIFDDFDFINLPNETNKDYPKTNFDWDNNIADINIMNNSFTSRAKNKENIIDISTSKEMIPNTMFEGNDLSDINLPVQSTNVAPTNVSQIIKGTDIESESDIHNGKVVVKASLPFCQFIGFKTANNKIIKVSEETLSKTKTIFKDIDTIDFKLQNRNKNEYPDIEKHIKLNEMTDSVVTDKNLNTITASNKYNKLSSETSLDNKIMFEDIEVQHNLDSEHKSYEYFGPEDLMNCCDGDLGTRLSSTVFMPVMPLGMVKKSSNHFVKELAPNVPRSGFSRFLTASNKQVKISEKALPSSRKIFNDIDNIHCDNRKMKNKSLYPDEIYQQDKEYKTGDMNVSQEIKENNVIIDFKLDNDIYKKDSTVASISHIEFTGFKTANNQIIKISDATLSKTKNIFNDIDLMDFKLLNKNIKDYPDIDTNIVTGKITKHAEKDNTIADEELQDLNMPKELCVKITSEAMVENKEISKSIGNDNTLHFENKISNTDSNPKEDAHFDDNLEVRSTSPVFKGFKTGNKKSVLISEKALQKSKELFKHLDKDISLKMSFNSGFVGFQTASNKRVTVSEKALASSKKIFKDIDNMNDNIENVKVKSSYPKEIYQNENIIHDNIEILLQNDAEIEPAFKGFLTASEKPVAISKAALEKSKKLFQEIDNTSNEKNDFYNSLSGNKKIEVSNEINHKKYNFLESDTRHKKIEENITEQKDTEISKIVFKGFQTGNNERINVSKEALVKSKRLFSEIADEKNLDISKKSKKDSSDNDEILNYLIDTQIINNFDEALHTDDFHYTPERSKRSGSPILSCSRIKKRKKFETPYNNNTFKPKTKSFSEDKIQSKFNYRKDYKKTKRYTLKDWKDITKDITKKIDPYLFKFNYDNLLQFIFNNERNDLSCGDMPVDMLKNNFLDSVNTKLVPNGWLDNHLKLILWKLISYEVQFGSFVCTVKNVLEQLKYRYDRELYNAERPALRKILEKDDVPSKTLILCVVEIYADVVKVSNVTNTTSKVELLLTDGWYCIRCNIDRMLAELVCSKKITVGTKLVTSGAELLGCEQGVSPWEDTSAVRLKIFGNSTRRARWDARLGYHSNGTILSQLSSVKVLGGKVSKLRVLVTRVYPALYVEKFEDGSTVTRSERLENLHQMKMEADRQIFMEKIYEEVEKEFLDQDFEDSEGLSDTSRRSGIESGSQIAKMMKRSKDPAEFTAHLTNTQKCLLEDHTLKNRDKLLQKMQTRVRERIEKAGVCVNRSVVSLLKIRVAGLEVKGDKVEVTKGMMSIWKPNDHIREMIKEGAWVDIMNVVPTALRLGEIQISAGRQSIFRTSKFKPSEKFKPYTNLLHCKCYTIKDLTKNPTISTEYNEIDTVGLIFLIDPAMGAFDSAKQSFQNIYLSDAESNIICVHFWGGLKKFGFQNILDTGQIVACVNLQRRAGNTRKNIPQYRVTELSYFTQTPRNDDARNILEELNKTISSLDRRKFCENCIVLKNNYSVVKQNNENVSPYRFMNNSDLNLSKNKMFINSPLCKENIQNNFNFSGLDFESTFKKDTQISPESLKRKRKIDDKIAKLKMYGEPPPLAHINIINASKDVSSSYKSPLQIDNTNKSEINNTPKNTSRNLIDSSKCDSDISTNVAKLKNTPLNCVEIDAAGSPVALNRTYVKLNPVKINFDVPNNDDPFAEELDGSLPLSLDDYSS